MRNQSILLIVGGGIAAYKTLLLIRLLAKQGIAAQAILTRAGAEFVTPLSLEALTGKPVFTNVFSLSQQSEMGHIELSRSADLIVVAPATAHLIAQAANGLAGDLAATTLLATNRPVLYAPAMNVRMWKHPSVQKNIETLRTNGGLFAGPGKGEMACGEFGYGRMAEPEQIAGAIQNILAGKTRIEMPGPKPLQARHILITAGPTREPIDPVRYLSNHSSGKQGYAIAKACAALDAKVTLVTGPTALPAPAGIQTVNVETAHDMLKACEKALPADVFIAVAAVSDWRVSKTGAQKIKKDKNGGPALTLTENPDILETVATHKKRPALVIGFAAETEQVEKHATEKRVRKSCDWILANDVSGDVMGGDKNRIIFITENGGESWPVMGKARVAQKLAGKIVENLL